MDGMDRSSTELDTEFDQLLVDMKPHVLKLPHKSERQRSAQWIKKFCEPPEGGTAGRKNRNLYAQLLLQMLKRGALEGLFTQKPQYGPLPTLPAYMSIYFNESERRRDPSEANADLPDWVAGELPTELSSIHPDPLSAPPDPIPGTTSGRERFTTPLSNSPPGPSRKSRGMDRFSPTPFALTLEDDTTAKTALSSEDETSNGISLFRPRSRSPRRHQMAADWRGYPTSGGMPLAGNHWRDESTMTNLSRIQDREVEMRTKMVEARYQEEKLRLQQKHDSTVQKILERKNQELEELKTHYRSKQKEQDDTISKLNHRVQQLQKEVTAVHQSKERQIDELKKTTDEESTNKQEALQRQLQETAAQLEKEKFDLQKQHTRNIQELLDDTNQRLQKMEDEYSQQQNATSAVIRELETRVQQLTSETETMGQIRGHLEQQKSELEVKVASLQSQLQDSQAKCSDLENERRRTRDDHEQEVRSLKNKHDATIEFMKQEHNLQAVKTADTISDLEQHLGQLKQALQDGEHQHQQHIRELEQSYQDDKQHLSSLHDNKMRNLQAEMAQLEQDSQSKIRKMELNLRDKEEDVRRLRETSLKQEQQSRKALQEFKVQVDKNSAKMFDDMKKQMEIVELDLNKSKQARERQAREFKGQLEDEEQKYEEQLNDARLAWEQERNALLAEAKLEQQKWQLENERHLQEVRENYKQDMADLESRAQERHHGDTKRIAELEVQLQGQTDEVVQANQLRKQQLVELGLLREEEKQKLLRDYEAKICGLKSEMEQQKLELEKQHNQELEQTMEKTNARLKDLEKDYSNRIVKSNQTISDLQRTVEQQQDQTSKTEAAAQQQLNQAALLADEERRRLKVQHHATVQVLQQEAETQKQRVRDLERKLTHQEQQYEDELTSLRGGYESRLRGLIPASIRQELEDTITSLKSQVNSLQQRATILQDELDMRNRYSSNNALTSSLGSTASIRSAS